MSPEDSKIASMFQGRMAAAYPVELPSSGCWHKVELLEIRRCNNQVKQQKLHYCDVLSLHSSTGRLKRGES